MGSIIPPPPPSRSPFFLHKSRGKKKGGGGFINDRLSISFSPTNQSRFSLGPTTFFFFFLSFKHAIHRAVVGGGIEHERKGTKEKWKEWRRETENGGGHTYQSVIQIPLKKHGTLWKCFIRKSTKHFCVVGPLSWRNNPPTSTDYSDTDVGTPTNGAVVAIRYTYVIIMIGSWKLTPCPSFDRCISVEPGTKKFGGHTKWGRTRKRAESCGLLLWFLTINCIISLSHKLQRRRPNKRNKNLFL